MQMTRIRNILVPVDFSPHSEAALEYAIQLAGALASRICLAHAYQIEVFATPEGPYAIPESVLAGIRETAEAQIRALQERVGKEKIPCETVVRMGSAAESILDIAKSLPADLIVMGTQGHTGLKHLLLGSVAEKIVRLASCPVLTVKTSDR
jgi:universal stress protein A